MKHQRTSTIGLLALLLASCFAAAADSKTPTKTFLDYHDTLMKATKLEEILPYMSAEYRKMLESQPKKDGALWLGRLREGTPVKDLKITKETVNGDKCTLEGTGTSA